MIVIFQKSFQSLIFKMKTFFSKHDLCTYSENLSPQHLGVSTMKGVHVTRKPGGIIFIKEASADVFMQLSYSSLLSMTFHHRFLTSLTIFNAALPTLLIDKAENQKGSTTKTLKPMTTFCVHCQDIHILNCRKNDKAPNNASHTNATEPIEKPLPVASRTSVISRSCDSCHPSYQLHHNYSLIGPHA